MNKIKESRFVGLCWVDHLPCHLGLLFHLWRKAQTKIKRTFANVPKVSDDRNCCGSKHRPQAYGENSTWTLSRRSLERMQTLVIQCSTPNGHRCITDPVTRRNSLNGLNDKQFTLFVCALMALVGWHPFECPTKAITSSPTDPNTNGDEACHCTPPTTPWWPRYVRTVWTALFAPCHNSLQAVIHRRVHRRPRKANLVWYCVTPGEAVNSSSECPGIQRLDSSCPEFDRRMLCNVKDIHVFEIVLVGHQVFVQWTVPFNFAIGWSWSWLQRCRIALTEPSDFGCLSSSYFRASISKSSKRFTSDHHQIIWLFRDVCVSQQGSFWT
jgi:hypothetical protein